MLSRMTEDEVAIFVSRELGSKEEPFKCRLFKIFVSYCRLGAQFSFFLFTETELSVVTAVTLLQPIQTEPHDAIEAAPYRPTITLLYFPPNHRYFSLGPLQNPRSNLRSLPSPRFLSPPSPKTGQFPLSPSNPHRQMSCSPRLRPKVPSHQLLSTTTRAMVETGGGFLVWQFSGV